MSRCALGVGRLLAVTAGTIKGISEKPNWDTPANRARYRVSFPGATEADHAASKKEHVSSRVVSAENLGPETAYPRPEVIACELVERTLPEAEFAILVVNTAVPWGIEATTGQSLFEVRPEQVVELDED